MIFKIKINALNQRRIEGDEVLDEVGHRMKLKIENKIKTALINANDTNPSLRRLRLKIAEIVLVPEELHDQLKFDIRTESQRGEEFIMQDEDYLFVKENFNFSDAQWTVLRSIKPRFPSLYNIEKQKSEINHLFTINEIVNMGYYVEPADWIMWNLQEIASNNLNLFINQDDIYIKIALDGFLLVRQTTLLNFSFAVINEGSVAASAKGTYALGFFQIEKENYNQLNRIVPEVWAKISAIREFNFKDKTYQIKYFDANDHKMQALVIFQINLYVLCLKDYLLLYNMNSLDIRYKRRDFILSVHRMRMPQR